MAGEIPLSLTVDLKGLRDQLASIPGITAKEARAMAAELNKSYKALEAGAKRSAATAGKAQADAAKQATEALKGTAQGLKEVSEVAGLPADKLDKLAKGFLELTAAVGPVGGAAVVVGAALGGAVVGAGALTAGLVALTRAGAEAAPELERLGKAAGVELISPAAVGALYDAEAALDGVQVAAQAVVGVLASSLAPTVEEAALVVTQWGLALVASADTIGKLATAAVGAGKGIADAFLFPLRAALGTLQKLVEGGAGAARALGKDGLAASLEAAAGKLDVFVDQGIVAGTLDALTSGSADYEAQARALFDALRRRNDEQRRGTGQSQEAAAADTAAADALKAYEAAAQTAASALRSLGQLREQAAATVLRLSGDEAAAIEATAATQTRAATTAARAALADATLSAEQRVAIEQDYAATVVSIEQARQAELDALRARRTAADAAAAQAASDAEQRRAQETLDAQRTLADAVSGSLSDVAGAAGSIFAQQATAHLDTATRLQAALEEGESSLSEAQKAALEGRINAEKRAASRLAAWQKASALYGIGIDTAKAITAALATLGPVAGAAAGIGIAATGAAQAAIVAAEKPPAFDIGGLIGASTPDQRLARVLPGEAVLNRRAASRLGEEGINRMNRGDPPAPVVVQNVYKHRVFDAFVKDNLRLPTSPLRLAMAGDTRRGQR